LMAFLHTDRSLCDDPSICIKIIKRTVTQRMVGRKGSRFQIMKSGHIFQGKQKTAESFIDEDFSTRVVQIFHIYSHDIRRNMMISESINGIIKLMKRILQFHFWKDKTDASDQIFLPLLIGECIRKRT